jgi:outer membrane protein assembly factor BamB
MKRSRRLVLLIVLSLYGLGAVSAVDTWVRTFEGADYGAFFAITLTDDEHAVAVGTTNHLHVPPYSGDVLLMKLTLDGNVAWERAWGGNGYEQARSIARVADGGFLVFGETDSLGAGDRDFFLLKIAADGSEEWVEVYGGPRREWPYGMLPLAGGDFLLYGFTTAESEARRQYAVRVTSGGALVWEYVAGDADEELILDALQTASGEIVLCLSIDEDGGLVKLNEDGEVQWTHRYELAGWQFPCEIAPANDGFLLAGFSMSETPSRQADTWLVRCSASGQLQWETAFGDPTRDDYAQELLRLDDGTYLIGGLGNGMPLSCVDQDGNVLWSRVLAGPRVHAVEGLAALDDGGFLVAGFVQIANGRSYDPIVLRTDADGQVDR